MEDTLIDKREIAQLWIDATNELEGVDSREQLEKWRVKWVGVKGIMRREGARSRCGHMLYNALNHALSDKLCDMAVMVPE